MTLTSTLNDFERRDPPMGTDYRGKPTIDRFVGSNLEGVVEQAIERGGQW